MLIEVASNVLGWLPSTQWSAPIKSSGGLIQEPWINSKFDILFGGNDAWNIGFGRNTHVFGPDLKVIADWTYLESKLFSLLPKPVTGGMTGGVLFGSGGATDFIMGDKGLLNYWGMNFTVERKAEVNFESKIPLIGKEINNFNTSMPWTLWAGVILGFTALLGAVISARIIYMTSGDPKNLATRILKSVVPVVESRWVGVIKAYEKIAFSAKTAKTQEDSDLAKKGVDIKNSALLKASLAAFPQVVLTHTSIAQRPLTVRTDELFAELENYAIDAYNTIKFSGDLLILAGSIR